MQRTESKSWPGKKRYRAENVEILKSRCKRWYENNRERLASSQRVNETKNTSEITKDNTVKPTGNGLTNIGDLIMPIIRNRSSRDFVTKNKAK